MKPSIHSLKSECPEIEEDFLKEHLTRLGDHYFSSFAKKDVIRHIRGLSRLSPEHPVEVLLDKKRDGTVDCTILAFDYPSEFSLIAGILAGMGFNILTGEIFTYERINTEIRKTSGRGRLTGRTVPQDHNIRSRIIDYFSGVLETPLSYPLWTTEVRGHLEAVIGLLEDGREESISEAKDRVNEMVIKHLVHLHTESLPVFFPVEIEIFNEIGPYTRMKVISEDTPAFLYSLSNALTLHDILIERVKIRTIHGRIEDQIDLLGSQGRKIEDTDVLNKIKLSVLLTKQFTYFLAKAPDPYTALSRFEMLLKDILQQPFKEQWIQHLTNPHNLQDLARLLGASDFLWEDFIRLNYESLLPMLKPEIKEDLLSKPVEKIHKRLTRQLKSADSLEEQQEKLNDFKDHEIFLIDLDHILNPDLGFRFLAERLTQLAELVVNTASKLVYNHMVKRFGQPRSIAGMDARYAVFGLGKLGGAALGYASDIELLFVYSDNGQTDGAEPIKNTEFFERLVKGVNQCIQTKREGIFQVDLRLRPYGDSGPLACSLESFCRFYGPEGDAHSYERLSLVRMRAIGGDTTLGNQVERLRDEMIFFSHNIDIQEIRDLRERQFKEKTSRGKLNAKFSPGGLVDLEYGVQILQVMHGKGIQALRTARIHKALSALTDAAVLSPEDGLRLINAYDFLRQLINGLRMLRGSAKDLFLPPAESIEFAHLARRMGYERGGPLDTAQQLHIDFERHTAAVRVFTERHFGRYSLPNREMGTVADLVLSDNISKDIRHRILYDAGYENIERAYVNLKNLAGNGGSRKDTFAKIALLAFDILKQKPNPDMALNNWERFIHSLASPEFHYNILMSQPMRLEMLLTLFSGSQFLADTLIRNPGFLDWLSIPEILHNIRRRRDIEEELRKAANGCLSHKEWLNKLRRMRRREILRIGTRDICLQVSTREIMLELSLLAEACVQIALERAFKKLELKGKTESEIAQLENNFSIMALGKLGGNELNYSSDIDLIGVWNDSSESGNHASKSYNTKKELCTYVMENLRSDLSLHTEEGYTYRVDLRLRPFGSSGELVSTVSGLIHYYRDSALLWEIQAALKLRPIAGNLLLGYEFLKRIRPILLKHRTPLDIVRSIEKMRNAAVKSSESMFSSTIDVKSGTGGIRDIEFMIQGLQLMHAPENHLLFEGNTLSSIDLLSEAGILPLSMVDELKEDYLFLRRTEHCLQLLEDRQTHSLPMDEKELVALAKRMLGVEAGADQFMDQLKGCLKRVRDAYTTYLIEKGR